MLIVKIHGNVWDLSLMRIKYNLTKETTKTEKTGKSLKNFKTYSITNFKTIRNKMTVSRNTIHSILNCKLMRPVSISRLPRK